MPVKNNLREINQSFGWFVVNYVGDWRGSPYDLEMGNIRSSNELNGIWIIIS